MVAEAGAKMGNQLLSINTQKRPDYAAPNLGADAGTYLLAWDPVQKKEAWKSRKGGTGGTMTTAGNLVFQANGRNFMAFKADTGEDVWTTDVGASIVAGAVTYSLDGVQHIAVVGSFGGTGGGRLAVFKLGGTGVLPPAPPPVPQVLNPPENFGTESVLALGQQKYEQNCTICHLDGARMGGFPDLRYSPYLNSDAGFKAVVIDGALTEAGMLSFKQALSVEEAEAIRAHVVSMANTLKAQPARGGGPGGPRGGGPGGPRGGGPGGPPGGPGGAGAQPLPQQPAGGMGTFAVAGATASLQPGAAGELHQ
jgi:hypothetical protein